MRNDKIIKEFKQMRDWWIKDSNLRPPEDPLKQYGKGCAHAFEIAIKFLKGGYDAYPLRDGYDE